MIRSGEGNDNLSRVLAHLKHGYFCLQKQIRRNHSHFIAERSVETAWGGLCIYASELLHPRHDTFQLHMLVSWYSIPVKQSRAQGQTTVGTEADQSRDDVRKNRRCYCPQYSPWHARRCICDTYQILHAPSTRKLIEYKLLSSQWKAKGLMTWPTYNIGVLTPLISPPPFAPIELYHTASTIHMVWVLCQTWYTLSLIWVQWWWQAHATGVHETLAYANTRT